MQFYIHSTAPGHRHQAERQTAGLLPAPLGCRTSRCPLLLPCKYVILTSSVTVLVTKTSQRHHLCTDPPSIISGGRTQTTAEATGSVAARERVWGRHQWEVAQTKRVRRSGPAEFIQQSRSRAEHGATSPNSYFRALPASQTAVAAHWPQHVRAQPRGLRVIPLETAPCPRARASACTRKG